MNHDIRLLSGIGEALGEELANRNCFYTEHLLVDHPMDIADRFEDIQGISKDQLLHQFIPQARLFRLEGMTERLADLLVESGLDYSWMARLAPADLREFISEHGFRFEEQLLLNWQLEASRRVFSNTLALYVVDHQFKPVKARVSICNASFSEHLYNDEFETDDRGFVLLDAIRNPMISLLVYTDNRCYIGEFPLIGLDTYSNRVIRLEKEYSGEVMWDELIDGPSYVSRPEYSKKRNEEDLAGIDQFYVSYINGTEIRLSSMYRKLIDGNWRTEYFVTDVSSLGMDVNMSDILRRNEGGFELTGEQKI
ncbi:MAG: hypothetical protein EP338_13805 [Bacteroidetes bacterium]|nr:MAG: hypothetical protein EP338_13805 [Bacteroidota bacterium]